MRDRHLTLWLGVALIGAGALKLSLHFGGRHLGKEAGFDLLLPGNLLAALAVLSGGGCLLLWGITAARAALRKRRRSDAPLARR